MKAEASRGRSTDRPQDRDLSTGIAGGLGMFSDPVPVAVSGTLLRVPASLERGPLFNPVLAP